MHMLLRQNRSLLPPLDLQPFEEIRNLSYYSQFIRGKQAKSNIPDNVRL